MKQPQVPQLEIELADLEALLERVQAVLAAEDFELLAKLVRSYLTVAKLIEDKQTTIARLRKMLFGSQSEQAKNLLKDLAADEDVAVVGENATGRNDDSSSSFGDKPKRPGHGRHGSDDYPGAERVPIPHGSLEHKGACPECRKGKVYRLADPAELVRVRGQAPIAARIYQLERLRCSCCGKVYTAPPPEGIGDKKYDETSNTMVILFKYGSALPWSRLAKLQANLGIPLAAATQWEMVQSALPMLEAVFEELIRRAAQGRVVYNDDTTMKVLELSPDRRDHGRDSAPDPKTERTGVFTSGIISTHDERQIALYFTGNKHAGENLQAVLARRSKELGPPIQMCDASPRNMPAELKTVIGNCLVHCRRNFVNVAERFPAECRHVIDVFAEIYRNEAHARKQMMSPQERLEWHQQCSQPVLESLRAWLENLIVEKKVEPNSGLGDAIKYLNKHWEKLTLFLREPDAPLDTNICERALRKSILHRDNSLFYKTLNGARAGDVCMSIIHTCELAHENPYEYLNELQRQRDDVLVAPGNWLPWNYRETLARIGATTPAPG